MRKWTAWLSVGVLSIALMGCGVNRDNNATGRTTNYNQFTNKYGVNATDTARRDLSGTRNANDRISNPQTYSNNSMFKDQGMGIRSTDGGNRTTDGPTTFGYATYTKTDMHAQQAGTFYVDRNVLARAVSTVVTSVPEVHNCTALVTDQDVFVGVNGIKDVSTLNKVKLSAWSVAPRYYRVHVTSDGNTIDQVKSLVANSNNRKPFDDAKLQSILKNRTIDMTGTNVTDNNQNTTNYNLNQAYPNTNGTSKMSR